MKQHWLYLIIFDAELVSSSVSIFYSISERKPEGIGRIKRGQILAAKIDLSGTNQVNLSGKVLEQFERSDFQ